MVPTRHVIVAALGLCAAGSLSVQAVRACDAERKSREPASVAETMQSKGLVYRDGEYILREEAEIRDLPAKEQRLRKEQHTKVRALLDLIAASDGRAATFARTALDGVEDRYKVEPFAFGLRHRSEAVRLLCARELGRLKNRRAIRPLLYRAVHDPKEDVRHAAIDAAKAIGDPNLIVPLISALGSKNASTRMHSADAIGRLGDVRGVRYLVYRFEARGGGGPRSYSMFASQLTFVQDFDVEVASTAFIADPIVDTIQEGLVLDVTVVATQQTSFHVEREVIHGALRRLTGATDVANEDGAWAAWLKENAAKAVTAKR